MPWFWRTMATNRWGDGNLLTFFPYAWDWGASTSDTHPKAPSWVQLEQRLSPSLCRKTHEFPYVNPTFNLLDWTLLCGAAWFLWNIIYFYLSANSIGDSPGLRNWGSRYQTSHTTAQEVISCAKCMVKDCLSIHSLIRLQLKQMTRATENMRKEIAREVVTKIGAWGPYNHEGMSKKEQKNQEWQVTVEVYRRAWKTFMNKERWEEKTMGVTLEGISKKLHDKMKRKHTKWDMGEPLQPGIFFWRNRDPK